MLAILWFNFMANMAKQNKCQNSEYKPNPTNISLQLTFQKAKRTHTHCWYMNGLQGQEGSSCHHMKNNLRSSLKISLARNRRIAKKIPTYHDKNYKLKYQKH